MLSQQLGLFDHLTHRANLKHTRYGWLRLTPAYSVHLVDKYLSELPPIMDGHVVLDPFCGTGTTALVCGEKGIMADTTDINPFLLWLTKTKTQSYDPEQLQEFCNLAEVIINNATNNLSENAWVPPIHQIEKWWDETALTMLSHLMQEINTLRAISTKVLDLLKISFCRTMIIHSNASFNHQSMSFKQGVNGVLIKKTRDDIKMTWSATVRDIATAAKVQIPKQPRAILCDARELTASLEDDRYTCVITSPPYPNRMSYIRELRPYMYWLGYLTNGREAGELDWKAIGGTWGIATSNVGKWTPSEVRSIPFEGFSDILQQINEQSSILSRYVHKYFYDMIDHVDQMFRVVRTNGTIHYIVGNSKFYEVMLPVERIFAELFRNAGFDNTIIRPIRKRTSKKELYEYVISARKP